MKQRQVAVRGQQFDWALPHRVNAAVLTDQSQVVIDCFLWRLSHDERTFAQKYDAVAERIDDIEMFAEPVD